jgi:hypothetical protein
MDQLKVALGWLKRHHFWVLCVVIIGIALYCWNGASGALQEEFERNQGTIKTQFDAQNNLSREEFHANDTINAQQIEEIKKQSEKVGEAWTKLYNRQREAVLKWPSELSDRFRNFVANLKFGDPIPVDLRNHYMNYVGTHFKKLPEKVGAPVLAAGEGRGGGREGGDMRAMMSQMRSAPGRGGEGVAVEDNDYIVQWLDQQVVRDQLYMASEPSSMRIWVTQEDLWVYHTLLQIIANTNEAAGADRFSNAAVRIIQSLEVGRPAAVASGSALGGRILMLAPGGAAGGADMAMMDRGGGAEMPVGDPGGGGGPMGDAPASEAEETALLLAGRYLDAQGAPTAAPGVEYKRLPVRMTLLMDQRWLPQLLAECASAPLQVEVQEVRINPSDVSRSGGAYDGRGGGAGGSMFSESQGEEAAKMFPAEPNLVPVIIQGVIYIFNEPNTAVLTVTEEQA